MSSEAVHYTLKTKVKSFHCGQRFKQLCVIQKKESPTFWMKILGVADKSSVYYRWENDKIDGRELILICAVFQISVQQFFNVQDEPMIVQDTPAKYQKTYIEDDIVDLKDRIGSLEMELRKLMKAKS